jgi:hypothetical protein
VAIVGLAGELDGCRKLPKLEQLVRQLASSMSNLIQDRKEFEQTNPNSHFLGPPKHIAIHAALCATVAAVLCSRLDLPLVVTEGTRTPLKIDLSVR